MANDCWGPVTRSHIGTLYCDDPVEHGCGRVKAPDAAAALANADRTTIPNIGSSIRKMGVLPRPGVPEATGVDEVNSARTVVKYDIPCPWTEDAKFIVQNVLPAVLELFLQKNRKYAEVESGYDLGDQGIIPDLNRKLGILVARIWHGEPEIGEPTDEVIDDMIGHLLLMKAKRRHR